MNSITDTFGTLFLPVKAFVVYEKEKDGKEKDIYVEGYDMDKDGYPINAHPLSLKESKRLAKALDTSQEAKRGFLKSSGLLPKNIMYLNPTGEGYAVWHTPARTVPLLFKKGLGIPDGKAAIPALLWKAGKQHLYIYALKNDAALDEDTPLYHAPFFNIYEDGQVCMGTVHTQIHPDCLLEEFMELWERYFFNSYFSHLINEHSPVKSNIVQLWQSLISKKKKFPLRTLLKSGSSIKNILT